MGVEATVEGVKQAFEDALLNRVVTRSLKNFDMHKAADLQKGVLTLVVNREKNFSHSLDAMADEGCVEILLIGQIKVGEKTDPEAVENAELAFAKEVKVVLCDDPTFTVIDFDPPKYSGQLEHPYGWFSMMATVDVPS